MSANAMQHINGQTTVICVCGLTIATPANKLESCCLQLPPQALLPPRKRTRDH
jgi:hypothetical protein